MNFAQLEDLVLQSLEHERGEVRLYEAALECAVNAELREEWQRYLAETKRHVTALEEVCKALGIDPQHATASRAVLRHVDGALVLAIKMARSTADPATAQLVAAESILLAETKNHLDWQLLGHCADWLPAEQARVLFQACERAERDEDEHLYHTKSWCKELWHEALGLTPALPRRSSPSASSFAVAHTQAAE